jgi:cell division protein ZipA
VITEVFLWGLLFLIPTVLLTLWLVMRQKHNHALDSTLYTEDVDEVRIHEEINTFNDSPSQPLAPNPSKTPDLPELIIYVVIKAETDQSFSGTEIMLLMDDLALEYGEMQAFHHYGLAENTQQKPVFSVVNMLEPGSFDLNNMIDFSTSGLILFMRLPGVLDGRVAFELMLNHAQNISQRLHGRLENDKGQVLGMPQVALLRERISDYEQKIAKILQ